MQKRVRDRQAAAGQPRREQRVLASVSDPSLKANALGRREEASRGFGYLFLCSNRDEAKLSRLAARHAKEAGQDQRPAREGGGAPKQRVVGAGRHFPRGEAPAKLDRLFINESGRPSFRAREPERVGNAISQGLPCCGNIAP